jgi:hypothetical protein
MTATSLSTAPAMPPLAASTYSTMLMAPTVGHDYESATAGDSPPRHFKKHKVLPRPQSETFADLPVRQAQAYDPVVTAAAPEGRELHPPDSKTLSHPPVETETGSDLPPTPPFQSRSSSGSHATSPPSPMTIDASTQLTPKNVALKPPETPPDQRSPPTPDVTPPQPLGRPKALRPQLSERPTFRTATSESRTESFMTAREEPYSSDDENTKSTVRPSGNSRRTSGATIREVSAGSPSDSRGPPSKDEDLAPSKLNQSATKQYAPNSVGEVHKLDVSPGFPSNPEAARDTTRRSKLASVEKYRPESSKSPITAVQEPSPPVLDEHVVPTSTAARAVRRMSLQDSPTNSTTPHETNHRSLPELSLTDFKMPLVDAKNPVPQYQRYYQNAYKNHTRLWKIGPRSRMLMTPYLILLWGTLGASFYGAGRKVLGYNSYFGN